MKKDSNEITLAINRKSRIVMKYVLMILKKVEKRKKKAQDASIILETSAPVCSKSIKFLKKRALMI